MAFLIDLDAFGQLERCADEFLDEFDDCDPPRSLELGANIAALLSHPGICLVPGRFSDLAAPWVDTCLGAIPSRMLADR